MWLKKLKLNEIKVAHFHAINGANLDVHIILFENQDFWSYTGEIILQDKQIDLFENSIYIQDRENNKYATNPASVRYQYLETNKRQGFPATEKFINLVQKRLQIF